MCSIIIYTYGIYMKKKNMVEEAVLSGQAENLSPVLRYKVKQRHRTASNNAIKLTNSQTHK